MPAGATYEPIANASGNGTTASITFSSLSSYTDLIIVCNVLASATTYLKLRLNGDTGTNYSQTYIRGDGTAAASARFSNSATLYAGETQIGFSTTIPMFSKIHIFNYGGSTNKTMLYEASYDKNGTGEIVRGVGLWRSTAAITSIELFATSGAFNTDAKFTLYGIKAA